MATHAVPHLNAWRIATDDGREGVLVQMGPAHRPYLWLLCPAHATLYLGEDSDLTDCSDGSCEHADVHQAAANLWQLIVDARQNATRIALHLVEEAAASATQGEMTGEPTGLLRQLHDGSAVAPVHIGDDFLTRYYTPELLSGPDIPSPLDLFRRRSPDG